MKNQQIIHGKASGPSVAVRERMNILEFSMKIRAACQCMFRGQLPICLRDGSAIHADYLRIYLWFLLVGCSGMVISTNCSSMAGFR